MGVVAMPSAAEKSGPARTERRLPCMAAAFLPTVEEHFLERKGPEPARIGWKEQERRECTDPGRGSGAAQLQLEEIQGPRVFVKK